MGSLFSTFTISPVEVYGPLSVPSGVPAIEVDGVTSTFQVQGRDFIQIMLSLWSLQ